MELSALAIFAVALTVDAAAPGPGVAALVARVLACGWREATPFVAAMWLGELVWLALAAAGLAALADSLAWAFLAVKYAGAAYLGFLAWRLWTVPVALEAGPEAPPGGPVRLFLAGLAVALGNPKIMVFYLALLPTLIGLDAVTVIDFAGLAGTMLLVLAVVDISYVALASRARALFRRPGAVRLANRVGATVMAGAAAAIATRS